MRPDQTTRWLASWDQEHAKANAMLDELIGLLTPMVRGEGKAIVALALAESLAERPMCEIVGLAAMATTELAFARDGSAS